MSVPRHCEERSDAAIQSGVYRCGLLRFARNDDDLVHRHHAFANLRNSATCAESKYSSSRVILPFSTLQMIAQGRRTSPSSWMRLPFRTCCWTKPPGKGSEEHTSELQSLMRISYAVLCLKKKSKK